MFTDITNRVQPARFSQRLAGKRPQQLADGASDAQRHAHLAQCDDYVTELRDAYTHEYVTKEDYGQALEANMRALSGSSDVQVLVQKIDELNTKFDQKMDELNTKFDNMRARAKNLRSLTPQSNELGLVPLKAEKGRNLGRAPPSGVLQAGASAANLVFPKDKTDLFNLSHAQLDALASFYEEDSWGTNSAISIAQRKMGFKIFIT